MVLNLKERKKKTFDIILLDGTELHIKKATEEQIVELEEYEKKLKSVKSVKDVFEYTRKMTLEILNRNTAGKVYDALFFESKDEDGEPLYNYEVCLAICKEYIQFTYGVLNNPN